jgi:pectin methylesterase-like acyl-CoA thioesterase
MAAGLLVQLPHASARTINVPGDYTTIQAGINAANSGDTIHVSAGRYYEDVEINKSISLIGDSADMPTIYCMQETYDANLNIGLPFDVTANGVTISNFKIQNPNPSYGAIKASGVSNLQIKNVAFGQNRFDGIAIDLEGCTNF